MQDRLKLAEYKVRVLEEKLRLVRIDKYGPWERKTFRCTTGALGLEARSQQRRSASRERSRAIKANPQRAQKHPGRQGLPADLPRVEQIIACTARQCVCGNYGRETTLIGYETAEQLDVEPAKILRAGDQTLETSLDSDRGANG